MSRVSAAGFQLQGIGNVQDFESGGGEGASSESMSLEMYHHLNDLMQRGNEAFREYRLEQAIDLYSKANNIKSNDPMILDNRRSAYLLMSHSLLQMPTSASEDNPLRELNSTSYAEFALNDAEKVAILRSNSVRSYILQVNALILLGRFDIARDVICSGLEIDPQSTHLLNLERSIPNASMRRNRVIPQQAEDYDCTICLKLLYEPLTTPCGHSFCRSCLFQSMDRGNRCPLCRTVLFISPKTCSISVTLNNIIQKSFPKEYAERKSENDSVIKLRDDFLPLFVKDLSLPCQKLHLNISEPHHRLMAVWDSSTNSIAVYACEVEITDCEPLPNGGFSLQVESRRRCRVLRHWVQDGYHVAEVEWLQDDLPPEGTAERNKLLETTQITAKFASLWLEMAKEAAQGDRTTLDELHEVEGLMPPQSDPERFSFWLWYIFFV